MRDAVGSGAASPARPRKQKPEGGNILEVEGRKLSLSNLDKIYYPSTGFTKGQVLDYYIRIAPAILPHLADRHVTLKRYPMGVAGKFFYEKRCPVHRPSWVTTAKIWSEGNNEHMYF